LIKSSLEAGHTLQRGMQVVEQEFADPLGGEFRTVVEETRLGLPISQALAEMLARVPEDDLRLFVVAVKVQTAVGVRWRRLSRGCLISCVAASGCSRRFARSPRNPG
jgi:Flp pilus assembly protein TadB